MQRDFVNCKVCKLKQGFESIWAMVRGNHEDFQWYFRVCKNWKVTLIHVCELWTRNMFQTSNFYFQVKHTVVSISFGPGSTTFSEIPRKHHLELNYINISNEQMRCTSKRSSHLEEINLISGENSSYSHHLESKWRRHK